VVVELGVEVLQLADLFHILAQPGGALLFGEGEGLHQRPDERVPRGVGTQDQAVLIQRSILQPARICTLSGRSRCGHAVPDCGCSRPRRAARYGCWCRPGSAGSAPALRSGGSRRRPLAAIPPPPLGRSGPTTRSGQHPQRCRRTGPLDYLDRARPNRRPIDFIDSPDCHRSQISAR